MTAAIKIKFGKFDDNSADLFAKINGAWGRIGWVESETVCTYEGLMSSDDQYRVGEYIATLFNPEDECEEIKVELFSVQGRNRFRTRGFLKRELTAPQAKRILKSKIAAAIEHNPAGYVAPVPAGYVASV
tara:strand:- start:3213 stop:3602 length:390 start_codon:yes stop_codon:yes gene_type:complete